MLGRIEKQLKRRFVIGSQVSEHALLQDFLKQVLKMIHPYCFTVKLSQLYEDILILVMLWHPCWRSIYNVIVNKCRGKI